MTETTPSNEESQAAPAAEAAPATPAGAPDQAPSGAAAAPASEAAAAPESAVKDASPRQPSTPPPQAAPAPTAAAPAPAAPADPLAEVRAEAARLKEQWMRTAADFDNFRKRARRDVEDSRRTGREELLKDLLPVFDNLERAILSAQRATEIKPVADGLAMVIKQFVDVVSRSGITKVATVGSTFDPSIHEAIQQVETDEHPPGTVISEVQPGYMNGERLVRAAMVIVAKPKSAGSAAS